MRLTILAIVLSCLPMAVLAGWFGPSTYDECILENMKGVGSDVAARSIGAICARKFPPKVVAKKETPVDCSLKNGGLPCMPGSDCNFTPDACIAKK